MDARRTACRKVRGAEVVKQKRWPARRCAHWIPLIQHDHTRSFPHKRECLIMPQHTS